MHSVFRYCFNPPFQFQASLLPFSGISVSFYFWRHHTSHSLLSWGKGGCPQEPDGNRLEAVCCCCCFKQQNLFLVPPHSSFSHPPKQAPYLSQLEEGGPDTEMVSSSLVFLCSANLVTSPLFASIFKHWGPPVQVPSCYQRQSQSISCSHCFWAIRDMLPCRMSIKPSERLTRNSS